MLGQSARARSAAQVAGGSDGAMGWRRWWCRGVCDAALSAVPGLLVHCPTHPSLTEEECRVVGAVCVQSRKSTSCHLRGLGRAATFGSRCMTNAVRAPPLFGGTTRRTFILLDPFMCCHVVRATPTKPNLRCRRFLPPAALHGVGEAPSFSVCRRARAVASIAMLRLVVRERGLTARLALAGRGFATDVSPGRGYCLRPEK